jgi:hypothetical protein
LIKGLAKDRKFWTKLVRFNNKKQEEAEKEEFLMQTLAKALKIK